VRKVYLPRWEPTGGKCGLFLSDTARGRVATSVQSGMNCQQVMSRWAETRALLFYS